MSQSAREKLDNYCDLRQRRARNGREQKSRTATEDDLGLPRYRFWPTTPTILSLRKTVQGVEYFELNRSRLSSSLATINLGDSEDESDANIFSVPDSETGQQSAPHMDPTGKAKAGYSKGTLKEFLSTKNLAQRLCHMEIKVFGSIFTTIMCKCTIITHLDDTNLNFFQIF